MLQVLNLGESYGAARILSNVSFVLNDGEHVGLIGPNGTGKSTLLRCIIGEEQQATIVVQKLELAGIDPAQPMAKLSGGEKTRLALASLLLRSASLLLLDEPLNHLDVEGREHFAAALAAFEGTVLVVAHDRAFLRGFAERVVEVQNGHVRVVEGGYDTYRALTRDDEV